MPRKVYPVLLPHPLKKSGIYLVSGIVLAGGESKRFGGRINKAFLLLQDKPLLQWVIERISPLFTEVIVVTNEEKKFKKFPVKLVKDIYPGYGALSGLHSGLYYAKNFYSFVCACDSPFISSELVRYLIKKKKEYDVIVPWLESGQEPFCALYSKNCLQPIMEVMEKKKRPRIIDFFEQVNVCKIDEREIKKVDPQLISFFNINTWADFHQAKILIKEVITLKEKGKQK